MKELRQKIGKYLQAEMLQKMWKEFRWIFQYARRYWKAMLFYTALGIFGTGVSLASSVISKDLVDIITGHQTGKLISDLCADDRIFLWKYPDFPGDQLCLDDD